MEGISDEAFEKILSNNIISNHWLVQMCAPQWRAQRPGSIIIVSSIGGLFMPATRDRRGPTSPRRQPIPAVGNLAAEYARTMLRERNAR